MKKSFAGLLTLGLALLSFNASAVLITSAGAWTNPTGTAANVNGVGTNQISWGNPQAPNTEQSSWVFNGLTNFDAGDITDGSAFQLGSFVHRNFPITSFNFTGADLGLNFLVGGNAVGPLSFTFSHNETANSLPCDPSGSTVCPDVVGIPLAVSTDSILLDSIAYQLTIEGFRLTENGPTVTQFITEEGQANRAFLYASLDRAVSVPEPSTLALFAASLFGLGLVRRRKA